jgi:hypothetical protein
MKNLRQLRAKKQTAVFDRAEYRIAKFLFFKTVNFLKPLSDENHEIYKNHYRGSHAACRITACRHRTGRH